MSTRHDDIWTVMRNICEESLQLLAKKVATVWPHIHFRSGDSSNPAFPLRLWGSFVHSQLEGLEGVDVSIDFKWGNQTVEVTADVAYESGKILSELSIQFIPLKDDGSLTEDKAYEVATSVSKYVQAQWELIGKALLPGREL